MSELSTLSIVPYYIICLAVSRLFVRDEASCKPTREIEVMRHMLSDRSFFAKDSRRRS